MNCLTLALLLAQPPSGADAISRYAQDALKAWQVPGVAVAVVRLGQPPIITAFGESAKGQPLKMDDLFPIASCTKAFTATLLATLVDERRMNWDDPVRRHLPEFRLSDANADAMVTIRDLLSHRTGVSGHDLLWYRSAATIDEIIPRIAKLPLSNSFRGSYQYSTLMYLVAGRAAANAGGAPWHDLLRAKILGPLGINGERFTNNDSLFDQIPRAIGHLRIGEVMPRYIMREPNPAGSLHLTIRDFVPWLELQLTGRWGERRIVSDASLEAMHSPQIPIPLDAAARRFHPDTVQLSYGLGWIIADYRGYKTLSHGGMIDGFRSMMLLVPEKKLGIALLNNLHDGKMNQALANTIADHCLNLPVKNWNAIFRQAVDDERAEQEESRRRFVDERSRLRPRSLPEPAYAGEYEHPAYGSVKIEWKDEKLQWHWSAYASPLEYWGDDAFRFSEGFLKDQLVLFATGREVATALRFQGLIFHRK